MKDSLRTAIRNILNYRFNLDEDKANEEQIVATMRRNAEFRGTNLWALIFAILIASIGLNINSAAVIIGAMLISPLMGPIVGIGLGAGIFDFGLIRFSLKNLFIAVVISISTSALYFWLTPIHTAQSELLARTSPTLWDALIAFFGGLAGIIAGSRKNISNAIPGVAIATALMPPLCTAGYGIGTGNFYYFAGAFYLFLINSVFISISTFLIVRFLKFKPKEFVDSATEKKVRLYIWTTALLTIIPSFYMAYRFVQEEIFKQNLEHYVASEVDANNLYVINSKTDPATKSATFLVYGEQASDSLITGIISRKSLYGLEGADVRFQSTLIEPTHAERSTRTAEPMPSLKLMLEKDARIRQLEQRLQQFDLRDSLLQPEYEALFGAVKELSLARAVVRRAGQPADTVLLVYIRQDKRVSYTKVKDWLSARYGTQKLRVIVD